jgi:hypothetical protein
MVNKTKPENKKQVGQWSWNTKRLNEKVIRLGPDECWPATNFAQTQHGPLFGCQKSGKPQMTQACRILYRDWFNEDCEEKEVTHACGSKNCLNPLHWEIKPIKKHGPKANTIKQATMKPIKKDFF